MITYDDKLKKTQNLKADTTLIITVNIAGVPDPDVSWYFGESELSTTNGTTINTTDTLSTLTMKGVSAESSGTYSVKAENTAGKDDAEFTLSVKGVSNLNVIMHYYCPPVIISLLKSFRMCNTAELLIVWDLILHILTDFPPIAVVHRGSWS